MQNDKIRTFFQRWLELTDKKKQFGSTQKCKVILVIDGIDRLETEENQQTYQNVLTSNAANLINYKVDEEPPDWFPQSFPMSFRVIVTCKANSRAHHHFKNMKVPFRFLNVPTPQEETLRSIIDAHFSISTNTDSQVDIQALKESIIGLIMERPKQFQNQLYLHTFLNIIYPQNIDLGKYKLSPPTLAEMSDKSTIEELFKSSLKHYETKFLPRSKFRRISCIMALSKTGLKKEELKDCLEVKVELIELYLKIFAFSLLEFKNQFRINNESYKRTIEKFYLQEEIFKNEIHSSIVTILSKVKQFNHNARLIDEVTYNIYKQGNQWLRLKDLLSNLEIFCHLYKPQDKYILAQYWQKLEQHGFDPVYEYNKTMEAFVLNYFPTQSELFVILTQLARFFKEFGDLETKCTPEFRHPPLVISPEIKKIKVSRELKRIGGMLIEVKNNLTPIQDDEKYSVENYLFMQVFREKQVQLLSQENPLFPPLQLYYYKRWIWLQFPWFCMDIYGSFSAYMKYSMGKSIHLHMDTKNEYDLVQGSLRIIREAKSRKQISGKQQIYAVPEHFVNEDDRSENSINRDELEENTTKISTSSDESLISRRETFKSPATQRKQTQSVHNAQSQPTTPRINFQSTISNFVSPQHEPETFRQGRAKFINIQQTQQRLSSAALTHRVSMMSTQPLDRKSQYTLAKSKWIDQDFELANLKNKIKPENAVRIVANQVKNYERKELETAIQINRELVNEYNRIAFEIQQKTKVFSSLQNCIIQLDSNSKENQAYEKKLSHIQERLDQTKSSYKISKQEQNRLKHIVNYCFKNKADNHEWIQGLERAVKNMVILIKHEKESIINAKNLVLSLRKESKELFKLKNERKMLQYMTQQQMYGMINEKQSIKQMREEFDKRLEGVFRPHSEFAIEDSTINFTSRIEVTQGTLLHQGNQSKLQLKQSKTRRQGDTLSYSPMKKAESPLWSKEQAQELIAKLEVIRTSAGAKEIEDFQQMIDFLQNYKRLADEKGTKESAVAKLRTMKSKLLGELAQFHNKDIDEANGKYEPHRLQNNISQEITQAQLVKNSQQVIFKKSFDQFIQCRVLIEELRKKMGLNTTIFLKHRNEINGEDLIASMAEICQVVDQKCQILEEMFGDTNFSEVMFKIATSEPGEIRLKFLQLNKRSRQSSLVNSGVRNNESKTHDGVFQEDLEDFVPRIMLNTDKKLYDFNEGVLIEDCDQPKSNKSKGDTTKSNKLSKRLSKIYSMEQTNKAVSQKQLSTFKVKSESMRHLNVYQAPTPMLDESSYTQSIINLQKPLKEKEMMFYNRVNEMERDSDVVKLTIQAMSDFKQHFEASLHDDSNLEIEEQRSQLKKRHLLVKPELEVKKGMKRVYSTADIKMKTPIDNMRHKLRELKVDQDIEPGLGEEEKQHQHKTEIFELSQRNLSSGHRTARVPRRRISINTLINNEGKKLPMYAKNILTHNHKDLLKKLYEMKSNVMKYDKDEMIKKLAACANVDKGNRAKYARFMHQNI